MFTTGPNFFTGAASSGGGGGGGGGGGAFTPASLPGLAAWFDASDLSTITSSDNRVSEWRDKSGNANHATQTILSKQYVVGANIQNGLPAVYNVDGTQGMILSSPITLIEFSYYAFVFSKKQASVNTIYLTTSSTNYLLDFESTSGGSLYNNLQGQAPELYVGEKFTDGLAHAMGITANGSGATVFMDEVTATFNLTNGLTINSLTSYVNYQLRGSLFEVIIGTQPLDATQIAAVKLYAQTKWGTP